MNVLNLLVNFNPKENLKQSYAMIKLCNGKPLQYSCLEKPLERVA